MQNNKVTIYCHIQNGVNTIVYEPQFLLLAIESNIYSITQTFNSGSWNRNFSFNQNKTLTSQKLLVYAGNSNSKFPELTYSGPLAIEINNVFKSNWMLKTSDANNGKFYLVSDLINDQNLFLKFSRQMHGSGFDIYIDNNYSPSLCFDQANASEWQLEYYPSSSNNTYLINTVDPNYPNKKLYLKLDCSYEIPKLTLWPFIDNGSIWGFGSAI